jgi:hypothetical protein
MWCSTLKTIWAVLWSRPVQGDAMPTGSFMAKLSEKLLDLPCVGNRDERHKSWMTAEQISHWWEEQTTQHVSPERIDKMLRRWWLRRPESRQIRPAKYPDRNTACRLWGHVERVHKLPVSELEMFRMDAPTELETLPLLKANCLQYFLSYAAPDLHYAARVRLYLASEFRVRSWMYAGEIEQGGLVFEGVQAGLSASQRVLVLATPLSLASAWTDTEMHSVDNRIKPVSIVFDASHHALMKLLETWHPPDGQSCFNLALLPDLQREYARHNTEIRVGKYQESATRLLTETHTRFDFAVYPRRPAHWKGHELFVDFDNVIREHLDAQSRDATD